MAKIFSTNIIISEAFEHLSFYTKYNMLERIRLAKLDEFPDPFYPPKFINILKRSLDEKIR